MTITYNGVTAPISMRVLAVSRSILPPSNIQLLELQGTNGAHFVSKTHGVRVINVDVMILGTNGSDMRDEVREVADWLDADEPKALIFDDEPDLTDFAILDGSTDLDELLRMGQGTITFICPFPYSRGTQQTETVTTGTLAVGGNVETYPVVTITFTADLGSFTYQNGTELIELTDLFVIGDVVVVNHETGKITVNGSTRQSILSLDSDYFPLYDGNNSLTVDTGATVSMTYYELWK